jgi:UDP-N-acetylmuramoyl-L-alanyl-D-glutamate--2,6-diaminopimelate ligase
MGKIAGELADKIVLTSEDPRFEDPNAIAKEIMSGMSKKHKGKVTIEIDREKAIDIAVNQLASSGDWIVTCGKGHEESMNLDGITETPWSDHEALFKALNKE